MVSHLAFNLLTAFSVSVNVEPDILVIDEALAVGDVAFQFKCIDRLERLTRSGVTILFVSHDLSTVKNLSLNLDSPLYVCGSGEV
jgi:ABC-type polysaccharide/polyol phosphate transport system ATPase subunit